MKHRGRFIDQRIRLIKTVRRVANPSDSRSLVDDGKLTYSHPTIPEQNSPILAYLRRKVTESLRHVLSKGSGGGIRIVVRSRTNKKVERNKARTLGDRDAGCVILRKKGGGDVFRGCARSFAFSMRIRENKFAHDLRFHRQLRRRRPPYRRVFSLEKIKRARWNSALLTDNDRSSHYSDKSTEDHCSDGIIHLLHINSSLLTIFKNDTIYSSFILRHFITSHNYRLLSLLILCKYLINIIQDL